VTDMAVRPASHAGLADGPRVDTVDVDFGSASGPPSLADARSELAGMVRNHEHAAG
jgi:hypothetical protein